MQIQNIDENLSMNISDTSGVSLQVSDVDTSLEMNVATNDVINLNIINEEGNISMEVETSGSKIEGTTDHSKLQNLDYEHSGHTGFQPKGDYVEDKNYIHTDNNFTDAQKTKLESLNNYDDTLIKKEVSSNTSQINTLKTSVENKAEKTEIPDVSNFITKTVDDLVNYYKKNETFNKSEIEQFSSEIMEQLGEKANKNEIPSLTGYATEKWVEDQEYMPIPDFLEYIQYFYYDKTQTNEKFNDYYNKEEIDTKLEELPTGGTELTGGDNTVIEDNKINVYTNTGYKVSDKDVQLQTIIDSGTTGTNKMIYAENKEIIFIIDGTNKLRKSENGIDFEVITMPRVCKDAVYMNDFDRLMCLSNDGYFFYSDDLGLTWNEKESSYANGASSLFITSETAKSFIVANITNKTVVTLGENFIQSSSIRSTISPDFITKANEQQFIWCNNTGTFKYGAGSNEGVFVSLSDVTINLLKRVNDITIVGLKNDNKMYLLETANSISNYKWVEYSLKDTCTVNDIIFNPNDETYYIFTDINTYYKTKDFVNYDSVEKNSLRGIQGYFTLMGIQMTTSNHNELLLAPTRDTVENRLQEIKRALDKRRWVGNGLILNEEQKIDVDAIAPLRIIGDGKLGIAINTISINYLTKDAEILLMSLLKEVEHVQGSDAENWFWGNWNGEPNIALPVRFTDDGVFYDFMNYMDEYTVERGEQGYFYVDDLGMNVPYICREKLGNFLS